MISIDFYLSFRYLALLEYKSRNIGLKLSWLKSCDNKETSLQIL